MYELKPLLTKFNIQPPTSMYQMGPAPSTVQDEQNKLPSDVDNVIARQENLLQQLNNVKSQLLSMRDEMDVAAEQNVKCGDFNSEKAIRHDIVINAHPNYVPYALLAVKNLWRDIFHINVKAFTHSSVSNISDEARRFQQDLVSISASNKPAMPVLNVTLIWKDCEHTEMIGSPTMYIPIYGEVNIIRYLGRIGPIEYRYENSPICNKIDSIFDICYQLLRCNVTKDRSKLLSILSKHIDKQQYFGGRQVSLADVAVYSSLKRTEMSTSKLKSWQGSVQKFFLI